jgi:hypothetical protein
MGGKTLDSRSVSVLVLVSYQWDDLQELHRELLPEVRKLGEDYEVVYLIGSALPEALDQARSLQRQDPGHVRVFQFARVVGEAAMLTAGIENTEGEVVITLPGRFEADLAALGDLYEAILDGWDVAFASRSRGRVGTSARVQSELFNRFVSLASGSRYRDIASGTRAFRREVADAIPLYGDFNRYLPILAERLGFTVKELPAAQHERAKAPRLHAPRLYFWRGIDVLSILFVSRFSRYPLRLFGSIGAVFAALGLCILFVVTLQRLMGTPLADRPVLVLGTLLMGLGVQVFTVGLLGELILFLHARHSRDYRIAAIYEGDRTIGPRDHSTGTVSVSR